jgi:hypothetical protein
MCRDLLAHGPQNVWICEVGSSRLNGSFETFLQTVADSGNVKNKRCRSHSVHQGCDSGFKF